MMENNNGKNNIDKVRNKKTKLDSPDIDWVDDRDYLWQFYGHCDAEGLPLVRHHARDKSGNY